MKYPQIIFVRHGQTDWNVEGRFQGRMEISLNQTGVDQAHRNGMMLAEYFKKNGRKFNDYYWVCSPQMRAQQTMNQMLDSMSISDLGYELDAQLVEISFGKWEGLTGAELANVDPDGFAKRKLDKWGFEPPEGESYKSASDRVSSWLERQTKPVVAVSHGGICRLLRGRLFNIPEPIIPDLEVPQDRFLVCNDGEGAWI